jgi:hypothetical protein
MLTANDEQQVSAGLRRRMDKAAVRRMVTVMLDGSGLTVRALKNGLVITNPRDRGMGRIYVEYATGHVTWERTVQDHCGLLQGFTDSGDDDGPFVGADRILAALGVTVTGSS